MFGCTVLFLRQSLTNTNTETIRLKFVEPLISVRLNKVKDNICRGKVLKRIQNDSCENADWVLDNFIKVLDSSDYNTNSILIHYFHPDSIPVLQCEVQEGVYTELKKNKFQKIVIETNEGTMRIASVKLEKSIRKPSGFYILYFKAVDFKFSNLKSFYRANLEFPINNS